MAKKLKSSPSKLRNQKRINKTAKATKKRVEANRGRRKLGIPKGSTDDASHKNGTMVRENRKANRSRGGKIGNKAGKARGGRNSSRKGIPNKKK